MSTSMTATAYFVYGYPTMRFSGVAVMISTGSRATRNHACGFSAAMFVIGANIRPMSSRYVSRRTPACARRALSNTAKVSHAWNTSCAISAGSGGDSHGKGRLSAGLNE